MTEILRKIVKTPVVFELEWDPPLMSNSNPNGSASEHHRTLKNSFFAIVARACFGLSRTFVVLMIARYAGAKSFGQLAFVLAVVEIFRGFSEFGLDTLAIRKFAADTNADCLFESLMSTKATLASALYVVAVGVFLATSTSPDQVVLGAVVALSLFSTNLAGAYSSYLQSQFDMKTVARTTLFSASLFIVMSLLAIWRKAPLPLILAILPGSEAFNAYLLGRVVKLRSSFNFSRSAMLAWIRESTPLAVMTGLIVVYTRLDSIIIHQISGDAELGIYSAALRLLEPALMIPNAFATSLFAFLSSKQRYGKDVLSISARTMWPAFLFILAGASLVLAFGDKLLHLLGSDYVRAQPVIHVLAFTLVVKTVNITLTALLYSTGKFRVLLRIVFVNLFANLILAVLLVPILGAVGAALAALATECINSILQLAAVTNALRHSAIHEPLPLIDQPTEGLRS